MKFDEYRTSVPWYDVLHWWAGRFVYLWAVVTMVFGVLAIDPTGHFILAAYLSAIVLTFAMILVLQLTRGQTHHSQSKQKSFFASTGAIGDDLKISQPYNVTH